MTVGVGLAAVPLPALCQSDDDMADMGLNDKSMAGLHAFNVLKEKNSNGVLSLKMKHCKIRAEKAGLKSGSNTLTLNCGSSQPRSKNLFFPHLPPSLGYPLGKERIETQQY